MVAVANSPPCLFKSRTTLCRVFSTTTSPRRVRNLSGGRWTLPLSLSLSSSLSSSVLLLPTSLNAINKTTTSSSSSSSRQQLHSQAFFLMRRRSGPSLRVGDDEGGVGGDGGGDDENQDRDSNRLYMTEREMKKSKRSRLPRDFEITDPKIMVIDQGEMSGPLPTRYVMSRLDQKEESLRMVRLYIPAGTEISAKEAEAENVQTYYEEEKEEEEEKTSLPGGGVGVGVVRRKLRRTEEAFARCEVVNKREAYQSEMEAREKRKTMAQPKKKTVSLTWGITAHDLAIRLAAVDEYVARGLSIDFVVAQHKKKRKREASLPVEMGAMRAMVESIVKRVRDNGGRVFSAPEGEYGQTVRFALGGVPKEKKKRVKKSRDGEEDGEGEGEEEEDGEGKKEAS